MENDINQKHFLPLSPWCGGFYERLIRIGKSTLRKILGTVKLNFEELTTLLIEIESVINTRPLSYLYENDTTKAITPSHLLIGRNSNGHVENKGITE